jgi:hypothetical protein
MMSRWAGFGMSMGLVALLAGCVNLGEPQPTSSETNQAPAPSETISTPTLGALGAPGCAPASPIAPDGSEVQGTPEHRDDTTTLYGLFMSQDAVPVRAGADIKVVWRMPGEGDLRVSLVAPNSTKSDLAWGPEEHSTSNYLRPGREWGTGFNLGAPGCWELKLATDTTAASVWIDVTS